VAPLRVGLAGAGAWARTVTGPVLAAGPETTLTGVWSRTPAHADAAATALGVPALGDFDALLETCDAVAVAVAPQAQPALAVRAAAAGRALLLEKPLAADVAGATLVADAVGRAQVGALVMLSNRFNPAFDVFVDDIAGIDAHGARGCFVSGALLGETYGHGWRLERGAVLDVGPHLLDLLEAALGPIVSVQAAGDPLGWTSLTCAHASGRTSSASLCCTTAGESRTEVEVFGRRGRATYDGRGGDPAQWAARVRAALVATARGEPHPAGVERVLRLQELVDAIERQLAGSAR